MKICPKCNSAHEKNGTYCSRQCANSRSFSEQSKIKKSIANKISSLKYWEDKKKQVPCKGCGLLFHSFNKRVYCDQCRLERKALVKVPSNKEKKDPIQYTRSLIETGELHVLNESVIRKHVKRWIIHNHGHACQLCGISEWNNIPVPLVCDHIDGNSTNSDINNFRVVCCNCDAQLDTYKSKNRGRGRSYDRLLYQKKSKKENAEVGSSNVLEKRGNT